MTSSKNVRICILMLVLILGCIAYAVVRDSILEERYGKHNLTAHYNSFEEFIIYSVLITTPLIGGCSAFRLIKASNRSTKINGWLLLVLFAIFFVQNATVCWGQYLHTQSFLQAK